MDEKAVSNPRSVELQGCIKSLGPPSANSNTWLETRFGNLQQCRRRALNLLSSNSSHLNGRSGLTLRPRDARSSGDQEITARSGETAFEMSEDRSAPMSEEECRMAETIDGMKHVLIQFYSDKQRSAQTRGVRPRADLLIMMQGYVAAAAPTTSYSHRGR